MRRSNRKGQASSTGISMMTIIELAFAILVFLTVYNIYELATNYERVTERAIAEDTALLLNAVHATPHDITYVYPESTPGKNITIIDNVVFVHPVDVPATLLRSTSVTLGTFYRSIPIELARYVSVDGALFSLTKENQEVTFSQGAQALVESQEKAQEEETSLSIDAGFVISIDEATPENRDTLRTLKQLIDLELIERENPELLITIRIEFKDFEDVTYGSANQATNQRVAQAVLQALPAELGMPVQVLPTDTEDNTITIHFNVADAIYIEENVNLIARSISAPLNALTSETSRGSEQ